MSLKSHTLFGDGCLPADSKEMPTDAKIEVKIASPRPEGKIVEISGHAVLVKKTITVDGLPARPANHPSECQHCEKTKADVERATNAADPDTARWIADLEHTVRRLAAVAGEKGARPPDMTLRENRVISTCMRVEPDDGYKS